MIMSDKDEKQHPQQINIELSEEIAEGIYSNLAMIAHSNSEFVIDFIRLMPGVPKAKVKSRIVITPEHAKRLLAALKDNIDKYEAAFKDAVKAKSSAVWITLNPLANSNQKLLAALAIANRLPSICARADYAENGCLMAYGPGYVTEGKDGARYVDKILKGGKPNEIPVEQPMKFELLFNLTTAKQIGVTIPPAVLYRADKLIK